MTEETATTDGLTDRPDPSSVLAPLRRHLDAVDRQILDLLVRRMAICLDVARLKAEHGIPTMQTARVGQVVGRARGHAAAHGLPEQYLGDIYARIIAETCVQEDALIAELRTEVPHEGAAAGQL
jgi:chorismate mutase-like protein